MNDKKTKSSLPFVRAYNFLLEKTDLTSAEKLALIVICGYFPSPFWGSNATVANLVGVSKRQIINIINSLKTKGLIKCGYAHRNRNSINHTVRVIVPLCFNEKCRLTGVTDFTCAGEISDTDTVKNMTQSSEADCTLLERNRRMNIKAASSPLPADGQAKPLIENDQPQERRIVRNYSQVLKNTLKWSPKLTQTEFEHRRQEQIRKLNAG